MVDAPNVQRPTNSACVRIGAGRVKGISIKKILFGIHCNRGARRQDGSMLAFGKFAVGGVASLRAFRRERRDLLPTHECVITFYAW
jgi:hypothetical protein